MRVPTPSRPLQVPGGLALSHSEKAEALADSLETHFQPMNVPSYPAVIEIVNEAMRAYELFVWLFFFRTGKEMTGRNWTE
jgi:hypothetical protein